MYLSIHNVNKPLKKGAYIIVNAGEILNFEALTTSY